MRDSSAHDNGVRNLSIDQTTVTIRSNLLAPLAGGVGPERVPHPGRLAGGHRPGTGRHEAGREVTAPPVIGAPSPDPPEMQSVTRDA